MWYSEQVMPVHPEPPLFDPPKTPDNQNTPPEPDENIEDIDESPTPPNEAVPALNIKPDPLKTTESNYDGLKSVLSTIAIIILAPLIAFTLTALVFQSYQVDGQSMETTLQNQDRLIVFKVPRTWAKITGHAYVPQRGDVVIFNKNDLEDFGGTGKKQLVKRVIGLPGDHIVIKDGAITISNAQHPRGFDPDKTLPYGVSAASSIANTLCDSSYCDITVPQGQVYVCGDNRNNSLDSRIFGPINVNDIVGKLSLRIFPFNKFKVF